ncbi:MAG TPA: MBL fold metallo-hydrolase [Pyrinomonadaceae bacterium]|jgi:glyoxylase-like metal-dependent hydrolase (beta-lactamase superfamily II)
MNHQRLIRISLILVLVVLPGSVFAQKKSESASERSYKRARQVLEAGIEALGGLENLRAIQDFTLKETGKNFLVDQSPNPQPPFLSTPLEETTIIDLKGGRVFNELKNSFPGGDNWNRTIIKGSEGFNVDLRSKTMTPIANPSVNNFRNQIRRLPNLFLLEVLDAVATVRWIGEDEFQGRRQNVISYVRADGRQLALSFDAQTHLLTKYDYIYTDSMVGDSLVEQVYTDYKEVGKFKVPGRRILNNANSAAQETTYTEVKFNVQPAESLFETPTGFERVTPAPAAQAQQAASALDKLSDTVYLIQNVNGANYNVMFVAFKDHVMVFDAPEPFPYSSATESVIRKIKETLPGKPVKFAVLTHHHSDHAGGARGYIAEGIPIVTTPGNKGVIERLAGAPFTVIQDALARKPSKPVFEMVTDKKRVFDAEGQRVELYDIGPAPHANEMLIAYLPKEKLLFQADLVLVNQDGTVPAASDSTVQLAEKIQQLGLSVEKIVGAHGRPLTMDEMRAALEKRKRASATDR